MRRSLVRLTLLFIGASLPVFSEIPQVFSEDVVPQLAVGQTDSDNPGTVTLAVEELPQKSTQVFKSRQSKFRSAKFTSKPIGPDVLEIAPSAVELDVESPNAEPQQRSSLIPTTWDKKTQLIPTQIDAKLLQIQLTGGTYPAPVSGVTSLKGKPLLSVKSAVHSKPKPKKNSKVYGPMVLPEQVHGPGYDVKYFRFVPPDTSLGVSTFPKKRDLPPATPPANDPERIRQAVFESLKTKTYRSEITPPEKKQLESAPLVQPKKKLLETKLIGKPQPVQKVKEDQ